MTPERNPWLESLIRPSLRTYAKRAPLALASVGRLLARIGDPHSRLRVIHIAGSKGKGATALMAEALLEASGVRTGTFTSPHLERWTERFRIGGREIAQSDLEQTIDFFRPHVERLSRDHPQNPPSFFDALTAMALWLFDRRGVDVAVIETGIGGRFDATNIVRPEVACITNIELEHTDKLGTDLGAIAAHKAGILKPGAEAVLGSFDRAARRVIQMKVNAVKCNAAWLGKDFEIHRGEEKDNKILAYRGGDLSLEFALSRPGRHMAENAALAIACVRRIAGVDPARLRDAVVDLSNIALPGRGEILRTRPWWIVDCAHTQRSIAALAEAIEALPARDRHFVISLSGDKPVAMLAPLLDSATSIIVTTPEPLRSAPAARLVSQISTRYPEKTVHIEPDVACAIECATSRLGPASLLCATGSTYIAGAARRLLLSSAGRNVVDASRNRPSVVVWSRTKKNNAPLPGHSPARLAGEEEIGDEARGV